MDTNGLDPCHYISLPSLSKDALLKFTRQELELISDTEKYNFFESGIRGGVSTCGGLRYAKANNPYLKDYDVQKPYNVYGHEQPVRLVYEPTIANRRL